mgnify:CR=1 FL=1
MLHLNHGQRKYIVEVFLVSSELQKSNRVVCAFDEMVTKNLAGTLVISVGILKPTLLLSIILE